MSALSATAASASRQLLALAEAADKHKDPAVLGLIRAAAYTDDPSLGRTLETILKPQATERMIRGFPFPTPSEEELYDELDPDRCIVLGFVRTE